MSKLHKHKGVKWFVACTLGAAILVVLFTQTGSSGKIQQPIAFNHKKHSQHHISCDVCHPLYKAHDRAGIPGARICIRCHEEVINHKPEKDKIQAYRESGTDIPWSRVNRVEPDIYGLDILLGGIPSKILAYVYGGEDRINFSHRRHVSVGKVDCSQCHGDIAAMDKPITQSFVEMDMDFCMSCHQAQEDVVSVDCAVCHR